MNKSTDYRKKIITAVDRFYFDSLEEFREAEAKIANDSRFRRLFKRKDYKGNIELLRRCKKNANAVKFPTGAIPADDDESRDIVHQCQESIRRFNQLCDAHIRMQSALQDKADGKDDMPYKEYKQIYYHTQECNARMNEAIKELDILYADYAESESAEGQGYMTYDMLMKEEDS